MKKIEIEMSQNFKNYAIENCMKGIEAKKIISELLRNDNIKKPSNLKIKNASLSDLKVEGQNIKGASMNISKGLIYLEY